MKKKTLRIITIIATIVLCLSISTAVFATATATTPSWPTATYAGTENITNLGGKIMGILTTFGMVIAVVVLMVLGIKYMMGSAEEKAEYKKTFIPYIVGAILLFAATGIAQMIFKFADGLK